MVFAHQDDSRMDVASRRHLGEATNTKRLESTYELPANLGIYEPASRRSVMHKICQSWWETAFVRPGRPSTERTTLTAACRSSEEYKLIAKSGAVAHVTRSNSAFVDPISYIIKKAASPTLQGNDIFRCHGGPSSDAGF